MRSRKDAIQNIAGQTFEVCIIGGGATGAGCALDAQLRGLRTVLLEGADFASAASSVSTKLVHGGVRYLEQAVKRLDLEEYRIVKRALSERAHMIAAAPHLAHPIEFLVPVYSWPQAVYYEAGLKIYDWISGKDSLFPSRYLSPTKVIDRLPALRRDRLLGAIAYADGQFDDSRYNLSLLQTFTHEGGEALNYARVAGFQKKPDGSLCSAEVEDSACGEKFNVHARVFVNATGPAADRVRQAASPGVPKRLRPSKGVHLLFPLGDFHTEAALLVPKTEDGRVIFAVPWLGRLLVGTTDDEATPETKMVVLREEAEFLLRQLNPYLATPLAVENVVSALSGLRPLVATKGRDTKELIRDHEVEFDEASGLISILGGKWTTYRRMAEDTIDAVQDALGQPRTHSTTRNCPLFGAPSDPRYCWEALSKELGVTEATARHLIQKFGTFAEDVLALAQRDTFLAAHLAEGMPHVRAEAVYAIRNEMAVTVEDVLARRIGLQFFDWRKAAQAAPAVAALLARELHWDADQEEKAAAEYTAKITNFLTTLGLPAERTSEPGKTQ